MSEHVGPTMIAMGGGLFELDRNLGVIRIKDFMGKLEFTPATLAYVLQQYGPFPVKLGPKGLNHWRMIEGTMEEG